MLISCVTDCRIGMPGTPGAQSRYRQLRHNLEQAVQNKADCVVMVGSLTETGSCGEYRVLRSILNDYPIQVWLCLGVNDRRYAFRKIFTVEYFDDDLVEYGVDYGDCRLIVVDTLSEGAARGSFGSSQADQLNRVLAADVCTPVLLVMNHAPIAGNTEGGPLLPWQHRIRAVLERHSHIAGVVTRAGVFSLKRDVEGEAAVDAVLSPVSLLPTGAIRAADIQGARQGLCSCAMLSWNGQSVQQLSSY